MKLAWLAYFVAAYTLGKAVENLVETAKEIAYKQGYLSGIRVSRRINEIANQPLKWDGETADVYGQPAPRN